MRSTQTRAGLVAIASGRPPALLAERGLDGALGALVLTAGLPVAVEADACADLPSVCSVRFGSPRRRR